MEISVITPRHAGSGLSSRLIQWTVPDSPATRFAGQETRRETMYMNGVFLKESIANVCVEAIIYEPEQLQI
jgi:hypothetical protein